MIDLKDRKIDDFGKVIFSESGLCNMLMLGNSISGLTAENSDQIKLFNSLCKQWDHLQDCLEIYSPPDQDVLTYHLSRQEKWFIPSEFRNIDVKKWLLDRCDTAEQYKRVEEELVLFSERNMLNVLLFLIYLVSFMRSQKIVWGVGRGSSVSSFCLYLIGVHKINSLKYSLDIKEFLK